MELLVFAVFCASLLICILLNASILYALSFGLLIFVIYTRMQGYHFREIVPMLWSGIKTAKGILIVFVLIGMLTALWRACGTIPVIVVYASGLIRPQTVVLLSFLLCCLVSVLTGTAFGTAATMGVVCMTAAVSMGADAVLVGGAILSGVFFGDRCSPVSTSAYLVSELTGTDLYDNIRSMIKTAAVPFLLTAALYLVLGLRSAGGAAGTELTDIFRAELTLSPAALVPAIVILALALFRVKVRISMSVSILSAAAVWIILQKGSLGALPALLWSGYHAHTEGAAALMDGGGIVSMIKSMAIVCLSSSYAGIFRETGMLNSIRHAIERLSGHITSFGGVVVTSAMTALISCNQTLAAILTHQLCGEMIPTPGKLALCLEDSVIVMAALVPWSIASTVPLTSIGASGTSIPYAFFLYLLPLWHLAGSFMNRKKRKLSAKAR